MPASFELDHARRIVHGRAFGSLTAADLLQHARAIHDLFADGTLDATWRQLADFSAATEFAEVSSADIRRLAAMNPWPRDVRRVFVVPAPEMFGLTRMYQLLTGVEHDHFTIVRSEAEALAILGAADPAR